MSQTSEIKPSETAQWYVVNTFTGNEDSVIANLKAKIATYGINDRVVDIKVIKEKVLLEEEYTKDKAPKVMKNTKNITWKVLDNGNFLKMKEIEQNLLPGYFFVKMAMTDETWYIVRNTTGVTGFVGSSGKGTKPFPLTMEEILTFVNLKIGDQVYRELNGEPRIEGILDYDLKNDVLFIRVDEKTKVPVNFYDVVLLKQRPAEVSEQDIVLAKQDAEEEEKIPDTIIKSKIPDFRIGSIVAITNGQFAGTTAEVAAINMEKGVATVMVDMFGRKTEVEVGFDDLKVDLEV